MTLPGISRMCLARHEPASLSVVYDLWAFGEPHKVQAGLHAAQSSLGLPLEVQPADLPESVRAHFPIGWRLPLFGHEEKLTATEALKPPLWMASVAPMESEIMWWWMARHRNDSGPGAHTLPLVYFRAYIPHLRNKVNPFVWTSGARVNHAIRERPWVEVWDTPQERDAVLEIMMDGATWFQQAMMWSRHRRLSDVLVSGREGDKPARL